MSPISFDAMTYNICNANPIRIVEAGASLEKYGWAARSPRIFEAIKNAKPTFLCCQELRDQDGKDGKRDYLEDQFLQNLAPEGYDLIFCANNGGRCSFKLAIAHKCDLYYRTNTYQWWNNPENPEKFGDPMGNGFGRVTLMAKYYPTINVDGVRQPDCSAIPIYIVNTHLGLKHAERMQHHKILIDQVHKIIRLEKAILAVMGDFNCFTDDGGSEELDLYEQAGFTNVKLLKTTTGLPIDGTFVGYPEYDKFVPEKGKIGSHLDRMMIKVMNCSANIKYEATINLNKYNGADSSNPQSVEEYLVDRDGNDLRDNFPSDHAPMHVHTIIHSFNNTICEQEPASSCPKGK